MTKTIIAKITNLKNLKRVQKMCFQVQEEAREKMQEGNL